MRSKVPTAIAATAEPEYKDYRSYYSYACLPTGSYSLFTYDSYGDGWEGGRITLTQVVNATTGCVLLSGASPTRFNLTTTFSVTVRAKFFAASHQGYRAVLPTHDFISFKDFGSVPACAGVAQTVRLQVYHLAACCILKQSC